MHRVFRTINGREYEYEEESYRVPGEKNPRKRSRYNGPVNPVPRKRKKGIIGLIQEAVRIRQPWDETEEQARERTAVLQSRERISARINSTLSKSMTLAQMKEIVELQEALRGPPHAILEGERTLFADPLETPTSPSTPPEPSAASAPSLAEPNQPSEQYSDDVQD